MSQYPPLKSLVFLDAAMRHNSFSLAAEELCVTPGAVGQQIQKLEEWLGIALFTRQTRQVLPTAEGLAYWRRIQPALAQIADASREVKRRRSNSVSLSMPPSFAGKWLPRRLAGFVTRYPDVELHLSATTALVNFERDAIDLTIRYFQDDDPNLDATLLYPYEGRVYCSPDYAAAVALKETEDLQRATLLDTATLPYWPQWLQRFSRLDDSRIAAIPCIHFDQGLIAIEAAKKSQGVVLASPFLIEEELAQGLLIEPFAHALQLPTGYYVVHHRKLALHPAAKALKDWLIEEARAAPR